eukprot:9175401-Alexandrium_andersonii.AAC.1
MFRLADCRKRQIVALACIGRIAHCTLGTSRCNDPTSPPHWLLSGELGLEVGVSACAASRGLRHPGAP